MKTIIDNCIWYDIESERIDISNILLVNPYVQNSNIDELTRSYNLIYSTEKVRDCIRIAMNTCDKRLIGQNPFVYVLNLDGQLHDYLTDHDKFIIELTGDLARGAKIIPAMKKDILENWIKDREKQLDDISKSYTILTSKIVENYRLSKNALTYKKMRPFVVERLKEDIANWTKINLQKEYKISAGFDFSQVELFLKCYSSFYKSLLNGSGKYKSHDSYDLYQLLYVQPGDKYWTRERKWQNIIYHQAKCPEYLFEYNKKFL